jgi:hypothetical protein
MAKLSDRGFHQCELLEYDNRYLELVHAGTEYQRWVLRSVARREPDAAIDLVLLQLVMFCPMCGYDGRGEARWRVPGRPEFNGLVARAAAGAQKNPKRDFFDSCFASGIDCSVAQEAWDKMQERAKDPQT